MEENGNEIKKIKKRKHNEKIYHKNWHAKKKKHSKGWEEKCFLFFFTFFFTMVAVAIRGSHVTTMGGRFWGAVDPIGGFGSELLTGRHTQANIIYMGCLCCFCYYFKNSILFTIAVLVDLLHLLVVVHCAFTRYVFGLSFVLIYFYHEVLFKFHFLLYFKLIFIMFYALFIWQKLYFNEKRHYFY